MKIMQRMAGVSEGGCHSLQDCCDQFKGPGFSCTTDYFAWDYPGAGRFVLAHVLQAVGYILLLAIWEEKLADRIANVVKRFLFASRYRPVHVESDQDVEAEARRVERGEADDSDVLVQNVRKAFKLGSVKAVNGVSLGIPSGQCFGLLGVNGAGKTTLFKVTHNSVIPGNVRPQVMRVRSFGRRLLAIIWWTLGVLKLLGTTCALI